MLDSAVRFQELALHALRRSVGPDHQRTVIALGNLAAFKHARGDRTAAEADYRELLERQTRLQGADHPVAARVRSSLAVVVYDRGVAEHDESALREAEALFRQSLTVLESRLGAAHPQVGITLDRLARVVLSRGQPRAALALAERAASILRAAYGDSNPNTRAALTRVATIRARLSGVQKGGAAR